MREFKRRSTHEDIPRLVFRAVGVLVLLFVTVVLVRAAWGMYVKMAAASSAREEAQSALARAQKQAQGVSASMGELATQRGEEAHMRARFGVVRPGEGQIVIVRDRYASSTEDASKDSWWGKVFRALFVW